MKELTKLLNFVFLILIVFVTECDVPERISCLLG